MSESVKPTRKEVKAITNNTRELNTAFENSGIGVSALDSTNETFEEF